MEGSRPGNEASCAVATSALSSQQLARYFSLVSVNRTWRRTRGSYFMNSSFTGSFFGFFL